MTTPLAICTAALLSTAAVSFQPTPAAPSAPAADHADDELVSLTPAFIDRSVLAVSPGGRAIPILTFTKAPAGSPTILIVAGFDARGSAGPDAAIALARKLAASPPAWLDRVRLVIIPRMNPDGFATFGPSASPRIEFGRLPRPTDADRDRRTAEDPAEDLNSDGFITLMRVRDPAPATGLTAILVEDPDWPGLMRSPDVAKSERALWAVLAEGIDNDNDGRFNEDGPAPADGDGGGGGGGGGGGLDLDRNFPILWPEFDEGAGERPLETAETQALVRWCLARTDLAAVLVFGAHDTVINIPDTERKDPSGQIPLGILGEDKQTYEQLSARYREITGATDAPRRKLDGSFAAWAYVTLGVPTLATPVALRPDQYRDDKKPAPPEKPASPTTPIKPEGESADKPAEPPKRPDPKTDDQKWLRAFEDYGVSGFVPWTPFNHPTLGPVEIGGFIPGARFTPFPGQLPAIVDRHAEFLADLAAKLPALDLKLTADRLGPGLWTIHARATNTGQLPTTTAMGARARTRRPTQIRLLVDPQAVKSGAIRVSSDRLTPGASFDAEWTVLAADGATIRVELSSPQVVTREASIDLAVPAK